MGALALFSALMVLATPAVAAPPTASFTANPNPAGIGEPVSFDGSGSGDPDGDAITYAWDLDNDGSYDDGADATAGRSYGTPGQVAVKLRVTDSTAAQDVAVQTLTITNTAPDAQITANPTRAQIGQSVTFSGNSSSDPDPGDSIAAYAWDLGSGSFASGGASITTSFPSGGDYTVRLRVTDEFGATDVATLVFHVNAKPVARFLFAAVSPEPGQVATVPIIGQQVGFASRSTDAEATNADKSNTIAKYEWFDANIPGTGPSGPFGGNNANVLHQAFATAGDKRVALRVTDNEGAVSDLSGEAIATVRVNARPTANIVLVPPTPEPGEPITFNANADDPDPDVLTNPTSGLVASVEWDLDGDGTFGETVPVLGLDETGQQGTASFASAGTKSVKLRVVDGGGARTELAKPVEVLPRPDARFAFSPPDPLPGQAVSFRSASTAAAGKAIKKVEWDFNYDPLSGVFDVEAAGPNVAHKYASAGPRVVALRVTDTDDREDIAYRTVRVNAPPRASFSVAPGAPLTDDTVTLASTSADPDGPISQAWDTDDDGRFDDATGAVASRKFAAPGSHTVRLRVTDDRGVSAVAARVVKVSRRPAQGPGSPRLTVIDATVQIAGRTTKRGAKLTLLRVRAPAGTKVRLKCKGDDCPVRSKRTQVKNGKVRFKKLERKLRAGTKLVIEAKLDGFIGKRVVFKIRRGKAPARQDMCIQPGAGRPSACPR